MQDKIKQNKQFLQDLESLKVERGINDFEAAKLLEVTPTYLSQIRGNNRNAGPKLLRNVKYFLAHPSLVLREKSNVYREEPVIALPAEINREVETWARQCGIAPREFVVRCLLNYGRDFRDELLNSSSEDLAAKNLLHRATGEERLRDRPPAPQPATDSTTEPAS